MSVTHAKKVVINLRNKKLEFELVSLHVLNNSRHIHLMCAYFPIFLQRAHLLAFTKETVMTLIYRPYDARQHQNTVNDLGNVVPN